MKLRIAALSTALAALILATAAGNAKAVPVEALSFEGGIGFYDDVANPLVNFNVGWSFTVNSPINVTSLGYFDGDALGLIESHEVGLYNAGGTLLASATVAAGTTDPLVASTGSQPGNGFRYHSITPVLLTPGNYAVSGLIGTVATGDDFWTKATDTTTPAELTYVFGVYSGGPTLANPPTTGTDRPISNFGASFQFEPVPEPGSCLLLGLGAIGLLAAKRRRRRA